MPAHARGRSGLRQAIRGPVAALALLTPLLSGCDSLWRWTAPPFRLSCRVGAEPPRIFRFEPRRQQVQELDPSTGAVTRTVTTSRPPPELGGGIIDDSLVTLTPRRLRWESSMYRPQFERASHTIDLATLQYTAAWQLQVDGGPDVSEGQRTGSCRRIDGQA